MSLRRFLTCMTGQVAILAVIMLGGSQAQALSLLGADVEGAFFLNNGSNNLFDQTFGHVPATGFGNSPGPPGNGETTVPISDSVVEFAYQGALDLFTANFTGAGGVTIMATGVPPTFTNVTMTFVSPAFSGLLFAPVHVEGTNNNCSFATSTITCVVTAGPGPGFTSTYNLSSAAQVPEPASLTLLALGLAGLIARCRKRA
jgi:PEP-CTERM motif-containing protein